MVDRYGLGLDWRTGRGGRSELERHERDRLGLTVEFDKSASRLSVLVFLWTHFARYKSENKWGKRERD
jgi:hypothetical protein